MPVNPVDLVAENQRKKKKGRSTPKGRPLNADVASEVALIIGLPDGYDVLIPGKAEGVSRVLMIEYLHQIHDAKRHLSSDHMVALAHLMGISSSEVYEVATFYAHFRVSEAPPPLPIVRVCDSVACCLSGASETLQQELAAFSDELIVETAPCMGKCHAAPVASVDHVAIGHGDLDLIRSVATAAKGQAVTPSLLHENLARLQRVQPQPHPTETFEAYLANKGYQQFAALQQGAVSADDVIDSLNKAGLRGLGGAGFPTARKWGFVKGFDGPRVVAINADEGEPGTFKDHHCLLTAPHRVFEAILIAMHAMEATEAYLYVRDEYADVRMLLEAELQKLNASPAVNTDGLSIVLRRGAGAYICGEESAMLESIEGKRGLPRHKPPFPAQVGLFGMPTLINNVETLYFVTEILRNGAAWFKDTVRHERHGFRHYSVSGRVRNPGVVLAEAGTTLDELINTHCGGMEEGHTLKGFLPGGASGGIFPASLADVPLDFDMFQPHGGFIGSAAVVVFSEQDSMADVALNLMKFFRHESCGQCTPCRVGTDKMVQLLEQKLAGSATAQSLTSVMLDASICGLGQAAPNPVTLALKHFPADMSPSS